MIIKYTDADIFALKSDYIVNPVNCVGVMGAGLAKQFKEKFPENYKSYKLACVTKKLRPGGIHIFEETGTNIINAATKKHWRLPSNTEYVRNCVQNIRDLIIDQNVKSIAIPALGCGLGGLDWPTVKNILEENLKDLTSVEIYIILPK